MSSSAPHAAPDYELDDIVVADASAQHRALASDVRSQILDLVLERAATTGELAEALDRPRSSVAHHVDVLVDCGLLKVVRTRKVRAVEERFYGRVGRTIVMSRHEGQPSPTRVFLSEAMHESQHTDPAGFWSTLRHARIPRDRAEEFFSEVVALAERFSGFERSGEQMVGFLGFVYETDLPVLPAASATESGTGTGTER